MRTPVLRAWAEPPGFASEPLPPDGLRRLGVEEAVDEDADINAELERSMALMTNPKAWPQIFHREDEGNVFDLVGPGSNPALPAHRKVLVMVFLLVIRDHASKLRFEPWRFEKGQDDEGGEGLGFRMFYEVDGREYELVSPPRWLSRSMAREIESLGDLSRPLSRVAAVLRRVACRLDRQELPTRQGQFRVRLGEVELEVLVWVYASALGDRYFLTFASRSDAASAAATDETKRILRVAQYRPYPHLCPDLQ